MGKLIHWELCKRLEFADADKLYMHKQEYVLENDMHKILLDFKIFPNTDQTSCKLLKRKELVI